MENKTIIETLKTAILGPAQYKLLNLKKKRKEIVIFRNFIILNTFGLLFTANIVRKCPFLRENNDLHDLPRTRVCKAPELGINSYSESPLLNTAKTHFLLRCTLFLYK